MATPPTKQATPLRNFLLDSSTCCFRHCFALLLSDMGGLYYIIGRQDKQNFETTSTFYPRKLRRYFLLRAQIMVNLC